MKTKTDLALAQERAAIAFDEFLGFGVQVAIERATMSQSIDSAVDLMVDLGLLRFRVVEMLNKATPYKVDGWIHRPQLPPIEELDPDGLWSRPVEPVNGHKLIEV